MSDDEIKLQTKIATIGAMIAQQQAMLCEARALSEYVLNTNHQLRARVLSKAAKFMEESIDTLMQK